MILPAYRTWLLLARVLFIWKNDDLRLRRSITVKHSYCLLTSDKINGGRLDRPLGHQYDRKQLVCAFFRCYSRFFFFFIFCLLIFRYDIAEICRHRVDTKVSFHWLLLYAETDCNFLTTCVYRIFIYSAYL